VVTLSDETEESFIEFMVSSGVNITLLGHVTKGKLQIDEMPFGFIDDARDIYMNALGLKIEEN
jgi:phosphoribosylformylglycinamidine synthase